MAEADDPWRLPRGPGDPAKDEIPLRLGVKVIEGVVPLDDQRLSIDKSNVPDALREPLFGRSDHMRGTLGGAAALYSYAVLDAAKVRHLQEVLAGTGLKHLCLFSGDAMASFGDMAPWIVELDAEATFSRNLFTQSVSVRHMWDANPGIFLRSAQPIDACWRHLRKFTRLPNESGDIYLFRFWESAWTGALLQSYFDDGLSRIFDGVTTILAREEGVIRQFWREGDSQDIRRPIMLSEAGTRRYLKLRQDRLCGQLLRHFSRLPELSTWDQRMLERRIETHVAEGVGLGLTDGADLFSVALGLCLSDSPDALRCELAQVGLSEQNASARRAAMLEMVRKPIDLAKARQRERLEGTVWR